MILTLSNFYFDSDLFGWEPKEMSLKLRLSKISHSYIKNRTEVVFIYSRLLNKVDGL